MKKIFSLAMLCCMLNSTRAQSGAFRVVIERVECVKATGDDMLERDGKGDEIQVCSITKFLNKKSTLNNVAADYEVVTPFVYGDINTVNWRRPFDNSRIRAGDRSALGGIQDNNIFPYGDRFQRLAAPTGYALPLIAWSGFLQNGVDSIMIVPFVAEWDNANEITTALLNSIGALLQGPVTVDVDPLQLFGPRSYEYTRIAATGQPQYRMIRQVSVPPGYFQDGRFYNNAKWFGDPHTRAVGMVKVDNGFQFAAKGLWLNYQTAMQLMNNDLFGFGKGKFLLDYKDDAVIGGGEYKLYLTIEKNDLSTASADNKMLVPVPYLNAAGDHSRFIDIPENVRIINVNSGKVLAINNNGTVAGDALVQSDYTRQPGQLWKLSVNQFGEYRIQNLKSQLCIDVSNESNDNGAGVIQWDWKNFTPASNNNNQRWILQPQGDGNFIIFNLNSGKALEVQGESRDNNAPVDQYDNSSARHQLWKIEKLEKTPQ